MGNYFYLKGQGIITKWFIVEELRVEKYAIKKIIK
jgi:hypothetical protein